MRWEEENKREEERKMEMSRKTNHTLIDHRYSVQIDEEEK